MKLIYFYNNKNLYNASSYNLINDTDKKNNFILFLLN